jgi:hypothetical protein
VRLRSAKLHHQATLFSADTGERYLSTPLFAGVDVDRRRRGHERRRTENLQFDTKLPDIEGSLIVASERDIRVAIDPFRRPIVIVCYSKQGYARFCIRKTFGQGSTFPPSCSQILAVQGCAPGGDGTGISRVIENKRSNGRRKVDRFAIAFDFLDQHRY